MSDSRQELNSSRRGITASKAMLWSVPVFKLRPPRRRLARLSNRVCRLTMKGMRNISVNESFFYSSCFFVMRVKIRHFFISVGTALGTALYLMLPQQAYMNCWCAFWITTCHFACMLYKSSHFYNVFKIDLSVFFRPTFLAHSFTQKKLALKSVLKGTLTTFNRLTAVKHSIKCVT